MLRSSLPRRVAVVALSSLLLVVGASCSKSDGSGAKAGTKIGPAAEVTRTSTTTTPRSTTAVPTTTALPKPVGAPTAEDASAHLYQAWKTGNRADAATVASAEAIDGIWATPPGDFYLYNHCDAGDFTTGGCLYRGNSGTIQFDLTKVGTNWVVTGALFSPP